MYENLIGLALTNVYVGVVTSALPVRVSIYEELTASPTHSYSAWYYDHASGEGALWIAEAGKHAEPIVGWLEDAQKQLDCTSMLAGVLDNGGRLPDGDHAWTFTVARQRLDLRAIDRLVHFGHFTMYLPYADEFRLVVAAVDEWSAIHRALDALPSQYVELTRRAAIPASPAKPRRSALAPYDPIAAQVHEVMGPITQLTINATDTLTRVWEKVWPPVPSDVHKLSLEISEEEERIRTQLQSIPGKSGERDAVLADVDRYAFLLGRIRRTASSLEGKLLEIDLLSRSRPTYEKVATPMMLLAVERYAVDIASRLRLTEYRFIPVIGEEFAIRSKLFPYMREARSSDRSGHVAAIVEIPAETRLRLGAIPMIAREIAWLLDEELQRISNLLYELLQNGDRWVETFLVLPSASGRVTAESLQRHKDLVLQVAREMAADLIAAAVAGPQYIFAMSRFAVGTLSQSERRGWRTGHRLELRRRIATCLSLLRALGTPAEFTSVYLPEHAVVLPTEVVDMVREATSWEPPPFTDDIDSITNSLNRGQIVQARPRTVLAALWRACVARAAYVNEQAALVSVAAAEIPPVARETT